MANGTSNTARIEAEMAAARERLASNVEGLITHSHPKVIASRTISDAKEFVRDEVDGMKTQFVNLDGTPKTARLAAVAIAIVGGIAFLAIVRSIARR